MNIREAIRLVEGFEFRNEMLDNIRGQNEMRLTAYQDDQRVGFVDYSEYQDDVAIKMVRALRQRQGVGTALIRELQRLYPDTQINVGSLTPDGAKLFPTIPTKQVDSESKTDFDRLAKVKKALLALQSRFDRIEQQSDPDRVRAFIDRFGELWNRLNDQEYSLEQSTAFRSPTKRLFV